MVGLRIVCLPSFFRLAWVVPTRPDESYDSDERPAEEFCERQFKWAEPPSVEEEMWFIVDDVNHETNHADSQEETKVPHSSFR